VRVLMVFADLSVGGAETAALELVRALGADGVEFVVASIKKARVLEPALASAGAEVHTRLAKFRRDPLALWRTARLARRVRPDAVVVVGVPRDGLFFGLVGSALSRRRCRRICWCNAMPGRQSGRFTRWLKAYLALGLLDTVVCASEHQRRAITGLGVPADRTVLIHNGVDVDGVAAAAPVRPDVPPGRKLIVQVANVMPDKDHGTLLRAAAELAARRDDFHVVLAGRGTDSPDMAGRIRSAGADRVVTAVGRCDDVPALLAAADVFALSTRSEVFNVATLEAMAAGRAVVVSDIPAFEEMIAHGREGWTVPPGDAGALAEALGRLLDDDRLRARLGRAGRRTAATFSRRRMAEQFAELLGRPS